MIESVFVCVECQTDKTKAHPHGHIKEFRQTSSRIDKHIGRQTWNKAASQSNRQAIRWRDWQAGRSGRQAARRGYKWTARKAEKAFRSTDSRAVGQIDRRRDGGIDTPTDREIFVPPIIPCGRQKTSAGGMRDVTESPDDIQRRGNGKIQKATAKKFTRDQTFTPFNFSIW